MEFAEAYQATESTESIATESQEAESNQTEQVTEGQSEQATETTGSTDTTESQETEKVAPAPIKVKYNHEEKEIPYEEATTLIQKGMNYDKVHGQLSERDAEVARRFGNQGITTWEQLLAGWDTTQQQQQQQMLDQQYLSAADQLAAKWGADPAALREIAQELANNHPAVMRLQQLEQENGQIKTQQQIQTQINQDAAVFKAAYPNLDYSTIPQEVWDRCNKGYSLMDSYAIHENKVLKEKIAAQEQAIKVKEQNKKNAANSPGSVAGNGAANGGFFTADQVKAMSQAQVAQNLEAIEESMRKW